MTTLIFGALVLVAVLWAVGRMSRIDPKIGSRIIKAGGGLLTLALAFFLLLRGQVDIAIGVGVFGLGLLGWSGGSLFAPYLNRGQPGGSEHPQGNAATGRASGDGKMSEEEAYQILGVTPGASAADISHAHRSLMKKLHPDQGGSTYLAARVNEAKEILLRRHRR